ncbi:MAG: peptidylprolyl isomerase [Planctomycetes bacterium]|nr:peptidylprolyl isomerase [Planctomycetota bacterium]MBI3834707.1 peptidylprolyl isomerase [Planctomycetota bacterium]
MMFAQFGLAVCCLLAGAPSDAPTASPIAGIKAHLQAPTTHVPINHPVLVQFSIENTTKDAITLTVPGTDPAIPSPEMGLPMSHVLSGANASGLIIVGESGRRWDQAVGWRAPNEAPILLLAPHSAVGTTIDLRDYFPALRSAGQYRLTWKPYGGAAVSESLLITIAPRKQVEIVTDQGTMTISLFYDDAPLNVANFLELAKTNFYTGKTFHRLEPGYLLQGGCPRGDGTGIRSDGKRVPAEINHHVEQKGSVSMALLDEDPDSGSCQFFICNTRVKDWDGKYTVFGQLVGDNSIATLDRIMAMPVDNLGRPRQTIYMRNVRIVDAPSDQPTDLDLK